MHWLLSAQSQLPHLSDMLLVGFGAREIDDEHVFVDGVGIWRKKARCLLCRPEPERRESNPLPVAARTELMRASEREGYKKERCRRDAAGRNQRSATRRQFRCSAAGRGDGSARVRVELAGIFWSKISISQVPPRVLTEWCNGCHGQG